MKLKGATLLSDHPDDLPIWFSGTGPQSDLVISTRIRLARNLANHRFPYHADKKERKEIFAAVAAVLGKHTEFKSFSLINCADITQLDRELLLEERLVSPDLLSIEGDRGVAIEKTHRTSIMINEEDHLRLHSIESGFQADAVWNRITRLDDVLGHYLPFAYELRRGFLTSCPTNSGTGLRVSFLLHLPGLVLTKTIDPVLLGASQMGISTRGFFGEHSEVVGNLFQLSNQATLGAREEEFLQHTHTIISKVIAHERKARETITRSAGMELSDKVHRSWGILLHARLLTVTEFLNLTSAVRLGIDCGLFKELSIEKLNTLTLMVMPAHLQRHRGKTFPDDKLQANRADFVREFIAAASAKPKRSRTKRIPSPDKNNRKPGDTTL
jgi:protein arginine kinase